MKNLYTSLLLALLLVGSLRSFAQVPVYNSYPSATAVIFLDFDGHTVNGTSWNTTGPIVAAPASLNADQIAEIYNRIAEDYRPFNLNITTDSTKYLSAPVTKRMRVIFTTTSSWYGNNAGGVAYTGSFTWGDNTPCFIFTHLLGYDTKKISEAGAHEAGHTLGLRHQATYDANCVKTSDYNYGVGSGEISWAPIMGVGYSRNFTTWHNGPNPYGCATSQPDLNIITNATNGFGYRADDYAETFSSASTMSFGTTLASTNGMISTNTDKDMFKFTLTENKQVRLNALPYSVGAGDAGSNLDMQIKLYDQQQSLISAYSPEQTLSVSVDTSLKAGTYYMLVDATGNAYASNYGSLGSYSLTAEQITLSVLPVKQIEIKGLSENGYHKLNWKIEADKKIVEQVIEVSANGKDFTTLAGDIDVTTKIYSYHPENAGTLFYRIKARFENKEVFYSNIIALRSNGNASRPQLVTNLIRSNSLITNSPSSYTYAINDYSGKVIAKGQISEGSYTINTNYLSAGTYMIRFTKGNDQYVERFMKQ